MDAPKELVEAASQLKRGKKQDPVTTRQLLSWFGAQRRGYYVMQALHAALDSVGLQTDPNFENVYIDAPIRFIAKPAKSAKEAAACNDAVLAPAPFVPDPTPRVGLLPSANATPLSVKPTQTVQEAVTLMLTHDYSQLPVMDGERALKGVISWASVGRHLALGLKCTQVRECMDAPHVINNDSPLFAAIETIVSHDYVLVQLSDKRIGGIVTTADLSLHVRQLAEPFLLIGEIENHIRRLIHRKFVKEDLEKVRDPASNSRVIEDVHDLNFGEYIRLLEQPESWSKLKLDLDRTIFIRALGDVRLIRNSVMHFDPDPLPEEDIKKLREFVKMMQVLRQTRVII